jgi:hypothetical protein
MPAPVTYPSQQQFIGLAKETTPGTPVAPTWTLLVDSFDPEDKVTPLIDQAMRGSMAEEYNYIQGVKHSEFTGKGAIFLDGAGFLLNNILGDLVEDGTPTGSGATTLAAALSTLGNTSISTVATIPNGTVIRIDSGTSSEVFTTGVPTGSGPFTIPLSTPSGGNQVTHLIAAAVTPIQAPFSKAFSLLNSGTAQPGTLTLTDYQGLPLTTQARQLTGCCLSELTLSGNAESELVMCEWKGLGWASNIAAAKPTSAPTTALPIASWRALHGIGGPATGGTLDSTIGSWELKITRKLKQIFTGQNSQNPYITQRGAVAATMKLDFAAPGTETNAVLAFLNNTQPILQIAMTNGGAGATLLGLTIDVQVGAFDTDKIDRGSEAVAYSGTVKPMANTTNAGRSGGYSPCKVTLQNNVAAGTY